MSASYAYREALTEMDDVAEVGLKASVEALKDGDDEIAAELLRSTARTLEEGDT